MQASLHMNYSHVIQNQNTHLFDEIINFTSAQCNETIVYSNRYIKLNSLDKKILRYGSKSSNQSNLKPIDIYYSEQL